MKRIGLLVLIFCVGLLATSFAFADDGGKKGPTTSTSSSNEGKGDRKRCRNVSLKGNAPETTFTVTVDKANKAGRDLKTATVTFSGRVNVDAVLCSPDSSGGSATASTLKLRNLKVAKAASEEDRG